MSSVATWTFGILLGTALVVAAGIVAIRAVRRLLQRRRTRLAAGARRALLALAADAADSALLDAVVATPPKAWRAVEPTAVAMLSKVRGEGLDALVTVFERRGATARELAGLRARTAVRRARAAEVLGALRCAAAVPGLVALLRDRHPDVRLVAARALGRIGDPAAARPLLDSLVRAPATPAHLVTHALTQLGSGASGTLAAALGDPDPRVRLAALQALRLTGTGGADTHVTAALLADRATPVRVAAADLLGRVGTGSAVAALLRATEADQPMPLRAEACTALGELGATGAAGRLLALLHDPHYPVAHAAAHALTHLGDDPTASLAALRGRHSVPGAHAREALALAELRQAAAVARA